MRFNRNYSLLAHLGSLSLACGCLGGNEVHAQHNMAALVGFDSSHNGFLYTVDLTSVPLTWFSQAPTTANVAFELIRTYDSSGPKAAILGVDASNSSCLYTSNLLTNPLTLSNPATASNVEPNDLIVYESNGPKAAFAGDSGSAGYLYTVNLSTSPPTLSTPATMNSVGFNEIAYYFSGGPKAAIIGYDTTTSTDKFFTADLSTNPPTLSSPASPIQYFKFGRISTYESNGPKAAIGDITESCV